MDGAVICVSRVVVSEREKETCCSPEPVRTRTTRAIAPLKMVLKTEFMGDHIGCDRCLTALQVSGEAQYCTQSTIGLPELL